MTMRNPPNSQAPLPSRPTSCDLGQTSTFLGQVHRLCTHVIVMPIHGANNYAPLTNRDVQQLPLTPLSLLRPAERVQPTVHMCRWGDRCARL